MKKAQVWNKARERAKAKLQKMVKLTQINLQAEERGKGKKTLGKVATVFQGGIRAAGSVSRSVMNPRWIACVNNPKQEEVELGSTF